MINIVKTGISILVSACLLALTLYLMDVGGAKASLLRPLVDVEWRWIVLMVLVCLSNNVVAAYRFLLLVRRVHPRIGLWNVLKVNAAALFLGTWTPLSIAGDGGRILWLKQGIVGNYGGAFLIVLWDRLIALAALLVCMLPFVPGYISRGAQYFHVSPLAVLCLAVIALTAAGWVIFRQRHRLQPLLAGTGLADKRDLVRHVIAGFLYVGTFFVAMLLAAASLGASRHWPDLLTAAPLLFLAQNIPITFGGLGSRELAFLIMLGPILGDADAVTISLVVGCGFLLAALPGGAVLDELRRKA